MKNKFLELLGTVKRPGINELTDWLKNKSDFFTAPASTGYHGAQEGGLLEHSLAVYNCLTMVVSHFKIGVNPESFILTGLLHDICKTNFYKTEKRWRKDESNKWEQYDTYAIEDQFPFGHGEKSVYIIEQFMRLSVEEAMAIRWHMGPWNAESYADRQTLNAAMDTR
ncbi:putative nucleotidyltransferase with HDIG domain [Sporomusaceae bacterium BoRhaA]|uniref:HD domain-containing protein n=1 Tax=Pelorhabdus rhamnosifermentans TaxID=2772457 RepID=UPI001C06407D|nr:HD domain-containing protein [Pelorhabdus rhamnosifermentans]MBU2703607.1 putative nucleotidyltransferase with HDIG domain [Pelorhabdus rhamnosifermentans]